MAHRNTRGYEGASVAYSRLSAELEFHRALVCLVVLFAAHAASADTTGQSYYTMAGSNYTPTSDVEGNLAVTDAVSALKAALDGSDWYAAKQAYTDIVHDSVATVNLQELAKENFTGMDQFDTFSVYYDSATWIDDLALMTLDGTSPWTDDSARKEGCETTVMNALLTNSALNNLYKAMKMGEDGERGDSQAPATWDLGWAYYTGAESSCAPYDLSKELSASTSTDYYFFCLTKNVIMAALPDGVSSDDIGELEGTESIDCSGVTQSPPAGTAVSPPPAGHADCTCACCEASDCPVYTYSTFYTGSEAACSADACRSMFYSCPDTESHSDGSDVVAVYGATPNTAGVPYTSAGSTYTPAANVSGSRAVTDDVCAMKSYLDMDGDNWAAIKSVYISMSTESTATVALQALAKEDFYGMAQFETFKSFYSSATWIDDLALMTLDGTSPWADDSARKEGCEKTVMDALLTNSALNNLYKAMKMGEDGETGDSQAPATWDLGWAYYTGAESSCAPYATADKRAGNYGTLSTTEGPAVTRDACRDVRWAGAQLRSAQLGHDLQCYAVHGDAEREAGRWYDLSKELSAMSDFDYYYFCLTKNVIMAALPDGVSSDDIGELEGTESIDCSDVNQSPPAGTAASPPPAGHADCTCACCEASVCPSYSYYQFYTGSESACSADACRSMFYSCPDTESHSDGSDVVAVYGATPNTAGLPYAAAGSTYTPGANVSGSRAVTDDVCAMKSLLDMDDTDWAEMKSVYMSMSAESAATVALQALAKEDFTGTDQFDTFKIYYDSATWIDDSALTILDGNSPWTHASARKEGCEKTVMNALLTNSALNNLYKAMKMGEDGETGDSQAPATWDLGWAYYTGAESSCAPYDTADKRAGNYGTLSTTEGLESTAKANEQIMAALVSGQVALKAASYDGSAVTAAYNSVLQGIQATYIQASIRYAYKMDIDLRDSLSYQEHRGEGWGFWRVVEPYIAAIDSTGAQGVTDMYDLSKELSASPSTDYYFFCLTKNVIMGALPDGVSSDDIGELEGTESIDCSGVTQSPPASAAGSPPPPIFPTDTDVEFCGTLQSSTMWVANTTYHLTCQSYVSQEAELYIQAGTVVHGYKTGASSNSTTSSSSSSNNRSSSGSQIRYVGALEYLGSRPVSSTCFLFHKSANQQLHPLECLAWYTHI
ncbi:hypothetical protein CYMTET_10251 [Cymbomonas tetramitiformis]|uniref:Uncharacterized protein n=1 Tax=Cymbomonas tetramitiformis TaxID=36881 RepID=A0AAE0LE74_9CHLO|nr:hypothetical protein CYMTET_10251 [Cymbomonas tetramitiformis]